MISSLIVFVKNPMEGHVKTRIAATTGHAKAVEIYKELLLHTRDTIGEFLQELDKKQEVRLHIFYGDYLNTSDLWNELPVSKYLQSGQDLGQRMAHAFHTAFGEGAKKAVIIGSDCLLLRPTHLQQAFDWLEKHEVVIGPATDGGYYLLGMKKLYQTLFENKPWSQSNLLDKTLHDLKGIPHTFLETLSDIDTWQDYQKAKA
ncbi:MAG: TIGR04282 family arsenosugar biosynthesis glycosyltransferase [Runella sp.]